MSDYRITITKQHRHGQEKLHSYRWGEEAQRWLADHGWHTSKLEWPPVGRFSLLDKPFIARHRNPTVVNLDKGVDVPYSHAADLFLKARLEWETRGWVPGPRDVREADGAVAVASRFCYDCL